MDYDDKLLMPNDLEVLTRLCRRQKSFFQFGTFNGRTAIHVAEQNPELTVYSLDLPPGSEPPEGLCRNDLEIARIAVSQEPPEHPRVHYLYGDSTKMDFTPWKGQFDVVFIDGAHTEEYFRSDTRNAFLITRPVGLIVWHDYRNQKHRALTRYIDRIGETLPLLTWERSGCLSLAGVYRPVHFNRSLLSG